MFVFEPAPEVLWPVTIETPTDNGETVEHEVKIRYRMMPQEQVDALLKSGDDRDLLRKAVTGWEGVLDKPGGKAVPFSEETFEKAIAWTFARRAIVGGFFRAQAGARTKN